MLPQVVDAILPDVREQFGNPSSTHIYGRRAHDALERGRGQVAALIGCDPKEILFTSGGTESNNLAIFGTTQHGVQRRVVTRVIEHPATTSKMTWLEQQGWQVVRAGVDSSGRVQFAQIEAALVTVMHSNIETGVLQPITQVASIAHRAAALGHRDGAQCVGKVRINVRELGIDSGNAWRARLREWRSTGIGSTALPIPSVSGSPVCPVPRCSMRRPRSPLQPSPLATWESTQRPPFCWQWAFPQRRWAVPFA